MTASSTEVQQDADAVMDEYRCENVPGFRRGKAPPAIIRQRYRRQIEEAVGNRAATRLFREALEERGVKRVGPAGFTAIDLNADGSLTFSVEFDEEPEIELPDFKAFRPSEIATDDEGKKDELSEFLLANTSVDLPESLVEQEIEHGEPGEDDRAAAENRAKLLLILRAIARTEGIEVDDQDVDDRIESMAGAHGTTAEALRAELTQKQGLERIRLFLLAERTMDYILSGEWQVASSK